MSESIVLTSDPCTVTSGCPTPLTKQDLKELVLSTSPNGGDSLCAYGDENISRIVNRVKWRNRKGRFIYEYESVKIPVATSGETKAPAPIEPKPRPPKPQPPDKCTKMWTYEEIGETCMIQQIKTGPRGIQIQSAYQILECDKVKDNPRGENCVAVYGTTATNSECQRAYDSALARIKSTISRLHPDKTVFDGVKSRSILPGLPKLYNDFKCDNPFEDTSYFEITGSYAKNFFGYYTAQNNDSGSYVYLCESAESTREEDRVYTSEDPCKYRNQIKYCEAGCSDLLKTGSQRVEPKVKTVAAVQTDTTPCCTNPEDDCCTTPKGPCCLDTYSEECCPTDPNYSADCCATPTGPCCLNNYSAVCCNTDPLYDAICCANPSDPCCATSYSAVCCNTDPLYDAICCANPSDPCCATSYDEICCNTDPLYDAICCANPSDPSCGGQYTVYASAYEDFFEDPYTANPHIYYESISLFGYTPLDTIESCTATFQSSAGDEFDVTIGSSNAYYTDGIGCVSQSRPVYNHPVNTTDFYPSGLITVEVRTYDTCPTGMEATWHIDINCQVRPA